MIFYPENTLTQLEFGSIKQLLSGFCRSESGKELVREMRIHTRKQFIEPELDATVEYKGLVQSGVHFPNDFHLPIHTELRMLAIPGAMLSELQFMHIKKLCHNTEQLFRWFNEERKLEMPNLANIISNIGYEKVIVKFINDVIDEEGQVKDQASDELATIRMQLYRKRNELRRAFDRISSKLNKLGYLTEIAESFMNGRRVLAVYAEQKRMVKGILHSESDSRRTSFIEPEETISLNNDLYALELQEQKEIQRILRQLTATLSPYEPMLQAYYAIAARYDFIEAKARLAVLINGAKPKIVDQSHLILHDAYHPLLLLQNQQVKKPTMPVHLHLDTQNRILVISGPNAGGKTVTMKTAGLLQVMMQSGLLVPVSPDSEMGVFKQMMMHMGDTQSIEFELSTYSAHLMHMKYFLDMANGRSLFFIDELGSGSDPELGGAFAEVIMEELAKKRALGIVTTHYLNLKVMANKVKGVINGAMQFDEKLLQPLYQLKIGSPGSSYTFAIAERIGMDKSLIHRAKQLVSRKHFELDQLLNEADQQRKQLQDERKQVQMIIAENQRLKKEMQDIIHDKKHQQEIERLQMQQAVTSEKYQYVKDTERKLKSLVVEWRKTDNKDALIKTFNAILFQQKEKFTVEKKQQKLNEHFIESASPVVVGAKVRMKKSKQVGMVKEIRGKKAFVQVGIIQIQVSMTDLSVVEDKQQQS
jgi:DNA mismatch repair protein MutS2